MKEKARIVFGPPVVGLHQGDGGLVAVFGLAAHQAQGLVDENGDQIGLLPFGDFVDFNGDIGRDLHAHFSDATIDQNPTLGNPVIGFTPGG